MSLRLLDDDLVRVRAASGDGNARVVSLRYWGDPLDFVDEAENDDANVRDVRVRYYDYASGLTREGFVRKRREGGANRPLRLRAPGARPPLSVTFVDVQQGDATFITTPAGRQLLIDGGEEVFIARLLASAFPDTTSERPLRLDALLVTHGDADHFEGLSALADAAQHAEPRKRIHVRAARVYHNGLVKRPERVAGRTLADTERFGRAVRHEGQHFVTELFDDPRKAAVMNNAFARWCNALDALLVENGAVVRRLRAGDHDAFDFLADEGIEALVLGPVEEAVDGAPALRVLRDAEGAQSASHTINGHSVILKLAYGNVRMLFGGDLNVDGSQRVLAFAGSQHPPVSLTSEVFKVPHHGSHEYLPELLQAVAPVLSVVSSGDESAAKEYVHPRANLMAALGRHSRGDEPLLFCTELAAFFAYRNLVRPERHRQLANGALELLPEAQQRAAFHAFERLRFGVIRVRTDGQRVLVAPESASDQIKEAYVFRVSEAGVVTRDGWRLV